MITMIMCSILTLLVLGWVLCTNSNDRKMFERELDEDLKEASDDTHKDHLRP